MRIEQPASLRESPSIYEIMLLADCYHNSLYYTQPRFFVKSPVDNLAKLSFYAGEKRDSFSSGKLSLNLF